MIAPMVAAFLTSAFVYYIADEKHSKGTRTLMTITCGVLVGIAFIADSLRHT